MAKEVHTHTKEIKPEGSHNANQSVINSKALSGKRSGWGGGETMRGET